MSTLAMMARLRNVATGLELTLRGSSLVGRSRRADVRLLGEGASMEHAAIRWDGAEWTLRDLNSLNGTWVNDVLLMGRTWRLVPADELRFGDPTEVWAWIDGAPPRPRAVRGDGLIVEARDGLLMLPDERTPEASVAQRGEGWELDLGGATRSVADGESLVIGGISFLLDLPNLDPGSSRTHSFESRRLVSAARLVLRVSLDQEHVAATFETPSAREDLRARSCNYMLLVLARQREQDQAAGIPPDDLGWIHVQELARKLGTTVEAVNVDVHRLRRSVEELGMFDNPVDVIERRRIVGQVRLGVADVSIA